jgi:hypothetical protein
LAIAKKNSDQTPCWQTVHVRHSKNCSGNNEQSSKQSRGEVSEKEFLQECMGQVFEVFSQSTECKPYRKNKELRELLILNAKKK